MRQNRYEKWDTWDAGGEALPIMKQIISICGLVYRSEHGIGQERTNGEGTYEVQCDCCWWEGKHGTADMRGERSVKAGQKDERGHEDVGSDI